MKPIKIDGKRVAYYPNTEDGLQWFICIVTEGEAGYRAVADYGPYEEESRAEGIADRLNERLGIDKKAQLEIVASSMRGHGAVRRAG